MLYYVKTGDVDTSLQASSHKSAAIKTLESFDRVDCGVLVVVSKKKIVGSDEFQVYFLTDDLMLARPTMRLVD